MKYECRVEYDNGLEGGVDTESIWQVRQFVTDALTRQPGVGGTITIKMEEPE